MLPRLMIHLWSQIATKSCACKSICIDDSRPRSCGFKMLFDGKGQGTAERSYLGESSLSTTAEGLTGFYSHCEGPKNDHTSLTQLASHISQAQRIQRAHGSQLIMRSIEES